MRKHRLISLLVACLVVTLLTIPAFSQQNPANSASRDEQVPIIRVETPQSNETSINGVVQAVDSVTNSLAVQYYDYESGQEKGIEITVNKDTKIGNVSSLTDIKRGDKANVTYTVSNAGNIAKSMWVEKGKEPVEEPAEAVADYE